MKRRDGIAMTLGGALVLAVLTGCAAGGAQEAVAAARQTPSPAPTSVVMTLAPAPTAEPTPTIEPTPESSAVTIGAVGDIMVNVHQVRGAYLEDSDSYDFTRSFVGIENMTRSMDLMCGNLETTLAGEPAGYTHGQTKSEPSPLFNAPDAIADALKAAGFDFLSNANNHVLDKKIDGLYRTLDMLDEKGFYHAGAARTIEERETPCIIDVQGIKVGVVAATDIINKHESYMTKDEAAFAVTRLYRNQEAYLADIRRCREAGAEFIIAYPHWDRELRTKATGQTRECARLLLEAGADVVLGSHSHVVQDAEYVTVERDGGQYTGLVVYSMGNFISNMFPAPKNYGLFVMLTLERGADGTVSLKEASFMPTYCFKQRVGDRDLHEVVPALADVSQIQSYSEMTGAQKEEAAEARETVIAACEIEGFPVMEDACWIN